jgi:mono/diheme cytochrome c family protein
MAQGTESVAYIADEDEHAIFTVSPSSLRVKAITRLAGAPSSLLVLADGRVVAALRDRNEVIMLEPSRDGDTALAPICRARVETEPVALAAARDGSFVAVVSGWGRRLTLVDSTDLRARAEVKLPLEPRGIWIDERRQRAIVSHVIGGNLTAVSLASPFATSAIDLRLNRTGEGDEKRELKRPGAPAHALAHVTIDGGERLLVPFVSVDPADRERQLPRGYGAADVVVAPHVAVVDLDASSTMFHEVRFESGNVPRRERCTQPRAAVSHGGHKLLVACVGPDIVLELDGRTVDPMRVPLRRYYLPSGPSAIAIAGDGESALVLSELAHELARIDLKGDGVSAISLPRRSDSPIDPQYARGRELFHESEDLRISFDGRSCATCHPDGRSDGLTWAIPAGRRQPIVLAGGIAKSTRFGWYGTQATLTAHLTHTFTQLRGAGFTGPDDRDDLAALEHYLRRMPVPVATATSSRDAIVKRGSEIFASAGCVNCHPNGGSDERRHDVKSGNPIEASLEFNTPSLHLLAGSAPYFHDGRYATLEQMLAANAMGGETAKLSREDRDALVGYLEHGTIPHDSAIEGQSAIVTWTNLGAVARAVPPPGPPAPGSRADLLRRVAPPELPVREVRSIDPATLPLVEIAPRPQIDLWSPRPLSLPASAHEAPELLVIPPAGGNGEVRLTFRGERLGTVSHRALWDGEVRPGQLGGAFNECGTHGRIDPVSWTALQARADGKLDVEEGVGWLNGHSCKLVVIWHHSAVAEPIADDVFAYRTRCSECATGQRERLQLVRTTLAQDLAKKLDRQTRDAWHWERNSLPLDAGTADRRSLGKHQLETIHPSSGAARLLSYVREQRAPEFLF